MNMSEKPKKSRKKTAEEIPARLYEMENILDSANQKMDALENIIGEYEAYQSEIQKLEAYYTSRQWKNDFEADEAGKFPVDFKRGILSEDGIYNMLERNKELLERIGGTV